MVFLVVRSGPRNRGVAFFCKKQKTWRKLWVLPLTGHPTLPKGRSPTLQADRDKSVRVRSRQIPREGRRPVTPWMDPTKGDQTILLNSHDSPRKVSVFTIPSRRFRPICMKALYAGGRGIIPGSKVEIGKWTDDRPICGQTIDRYV